MTRLLIYEPSYRTVAAELAAYGDALELLIMDEAAELSIDGVAVAPEDAKPDIAWLSGGLWMTRAALPFFRVMLGAPSLKWVQSAAAGYDNPFFGRLVAGGARLTTSHGQSVGMADYVLAGVLDAFQRGPERRAAQARREWVELPFREILNSTWMIIGFGAIGQAVATRARGFGAKVIGVRRNQTPDPLVEEIISQGGVLGRLPHTDVVVLSAPLNPATRHLGDAAFFAAMKPGSVLVNVGRGGLIEEAALLAALERGVPSHAVLDVFETEPLPPESAFWTHPRVSLTAHASGVTGAQDGRNRDLFLENLGLYFAGQPLISEADPKDVIAGKAV